MFLAAVIVALVGVLGRAPRFLKMSSKLNQAACFISPNGENQILELIIGQTLIQSWLIWIIVMVIWFWKEMGWWY